MDFDVEDRLARHRPAARQWADRHVEPGWRDQALRSGVHHNPTLHALLARDGILGAGWPPEYGGSDVDPDFARAVLDEINRLGLRSVGWSNTWMVAKTIMEVGTEAQKRDLVASALRGETIFSLGYTEPESGSDVAAARTRAVREGDRWRINGAKMFTSTANIATHVILLTRTNPEAPKHRGLTLFLVPLDRPGVEVKPIRTLGGQRTNATFYTNVDVPDSLRLGEVDAGWSVMRVALVFERSGGTRRVGDTLATRVAAWARQTPAATGEAVLDQPTVRETLARMAIDDEVSRLLYLYVDWVAEQGGLPGVEGAVAKLVTTERLQHTQAGLLDLIGPEALLSQGNPDAPLNGDVEYEFRNGVVGTIYGGASEILRDIIAERRLGLPRSRPAT